MTNLRKALIFVKLLLSDPEGANVFFFFGDFSELFARFIWFNGFIANSKMGPNLANEVIISLE